MNIQNAQQQTMDFIKSDGANTIIYSIASAIVAIVLLYILFKGPKTSIPPESTNLVCTSICGTNALRYKKDDEYINYTLKDFYIKSAYNCCAVGSYKNDYLSLDMLKYVLRQGVRFLDFAIYSINNLPVVATSSLSNNTKTSYNYLLFSDVLQIINDFSFSTAYCPNPNDPIFINLRIYSTSTSMIKNLGDLMQKYTNNFLNTKYSFDNQDDINKNFGNVYLKDLCGKIVLFVQKNNLCYDDKCPLYEYINMISESDMLYGLRYYYVENTHDMTDLIDHNKQFMTIVFPEIGDNPSNPNPTICNNFACQFTCMRYQLDDAYDTYLKEYNTVFNQAGYAFALKPEDLRFKLIPLDPNIPQKPGNNYAERRVIGQYPNTSFTI